MQKTSRKIFIEQVRLLYVNSMIPILASVVAGAALCWSLQIIVNKTALIVWFTLFFTISVDDFGTGYSSLSYLKSLPLNTLKIDRAFVNDIKDAGQDIVLVDTIIMMAHNLRMAVIAEGVETEQELLYLSTRGCKVYQGYYFSKAVAVKTFTEMLESGYSSLAGKELS